MINIKTSRELSIAHEKQQSDHYSDENNNRGTIKRLKQEEMVGYRTEVQRGTATLKPIHWDSIERSKRIHSIGSFN